MTVEIHPVRGVPDVRPGDDLVGCLAGLFGPLALRPDGAAVLEHLAQDLLLLGQQAFPDTLFAQGRSGRFE